MASIFRILLVNLFYTGREPTFTTLAITDTPCLLTAHLTNIKPSKYQETRVRRGVALYPRTHYTFTTQVSYPQTNLDQARTHLFTIPAWAANSFAYIFFSAKKDGLDSPSQSPIFSIQNNLIAMTWDANLASFLFDSLDGWDLSDTWGGDSVTLDKDGAILALGAAPPGRAKLFKDSGGWAHMQLASPQCFRAIMAFDFPHTNRTTWALLGRRAAPWSAFGFWIDENDIRLYCRNDLGYRSVKIGELNFPMRSYIMEAYLTPGQTVIGYLDRAYKATLDERIPNWPGGGPSFELYSTTEPDISDRLFRADVLSFEWDVAWQPAL